jgi:hypothetical protein
MYERKRLKDDVFSKVERDREIRLKKIEKDHNDSEILMVRTHSQAKLSVHEVKNMTDYREIIKKSTDFTIANTFVVEVVDNANDTFESPRNRK